MSKIWKSQPAGTYFTLRQANPARFRKLYTQSYTILRVLGGSKWIHRSDGTRHCVKQGDLVLFRAGESLTFENHPTEESPYRAEGISFRAKFFEGFAATLSSSRKTTDSGFRSFDCEGDCRVAFEAACDGLMRQDLPPAVVENRLREVLIWLDHKGVKLSLARVPSLGERVRLLICTDLEHRWRVPAVARQLAVSEATLRRRLADEGTSFTEILQDARLSHALDLLMTSDVAITEISYRVGFRSPSTFSKSFKDRFELTPREIRLPKEGNDRIQTKFDRTPTAQGNIASYS